MQQEFRHDEIGYWTEIKHQIIKEYAKAYSIIMSAQKVHFHYLYIDAFAGSGTHKSKGTGEFVLGSPLHALNVDPPFHEYHFIELRPQKVESLEKLVGPRSDVKIYLGDCNKILLESVLPLARREDYSRALCVLDPYGMHIDWEVVQKIGLMKSVEIFLNFPIMDINMNVLKHRPEKVLPTQIERMNRFWGDGSWRDELYSLSPQMSIFGEEEVKVRNEQVAEVFRRRLIEVAGFLNVPQPLPMRNSINSIVYYLFFASHNDTGNKIVSYIFNNFKDRTGF